jgi:hypothetical protein
MITNCLHDDEYNINKKAQLLAADRDEVRVLEGLCKLTGIMVTMP